MTTAKSTTPLVPLSNFSDLTVKLNKLNKAFLERIEYDLRHNEIFDITPMQALTLKNISNESKCNMAMTLKQGYYVGKNINYNVSSLLYKGYLIKNIDNNDKRCVFLSLTEKGTKALNLINDSLLTQQEALTKGGIKDTGISNTISIIDKLLVILDIK